MAWTKDQKLAIKEFGKNIIVSAGAGSGKTAVLSERVLEHVKNGIEIDEILVLTFTNAAAEEMKRRIREKLIKNKLFNQASKIDISYITTFDAFALQLVKKYSYTLNISKNINVVDDSLINIKKEEILTNIFDRYYEEKNELFLKLLNDLTLKDDKEIFDSIIELDKSLDNVIDKEDYLNKYIVNYYNDINVNKLIDDYIVFLEKKIKQIKLQLDNISSYIDNDYYNLLASSLSDLINSKTYETIKLNSINVDMPRLPNNSTKEASLIKDEISKLIKELIELTDFSSIEEIINSIYLTKDYVDIIIKTVLELNSKLLEYKNGINSYEFIDIAKMAIRILQDNEDIRLELRDKFKEILIDEYQDTNDLQDLFMSLIRNNNEYVVGDIKQSIYRFRNANPEIFRLKYNNYSKSETDLKIDLKENFRSRNEVVNNINLIFNLVMNEAIGGANYVIDHQMVFGQEKYTNTYNLNYNMEILNYDLEENKKYSSTEVEIFTIAKDIKNKIDNKYKVSYEEDDVFKERDVTYGDFCILIDRSKHFELYKKVFEYLNIPITIMKDTKITDSLDIDIIKNIYNLIICVKNNDLKEKFRYSFMSIARSYLFEYSDNQILTIFNNNKYLNDEIYLIIKDVVKDVDNLTNKQIYELILDKFDIYNKLIKVGNIKEHITILDYINNVIRNLDKIGYTYLDFKEYLDNIITKDLDISLSLNKGESNTVKIMTIHTSKGLEYPICYYPSLNEEFNITEVKEKYAYNKKYGIIVPYLDANGIKTTIVKSMFKKEYYDEEVSEKLRLFYVALTRTREKMIFVTSLKENVLAYKDGEVIDDNTRGKYRSFNDILNSIYKYISKYIVNVDINELELTKAYNYQKDINYNITGGNKLNVVEITNNNTQIESKHFSKENYKLYSKEEKENIELGLRMHYILEITDFYNPDYSNLSDSEIRLLKRFIDTKIYDGAKKIYKELEFYTTNESVIEHGIIDLLLEFDDYNIIIDYKLKNVLDEAYLKQLDGYKKYVEKTTSKRTLTYLYSIIDGSLTKIEK